MFTATQLAGFGAGRSSADPYAELVVLLVQPASTDVSILDYSQFRRSVTANGSAALGGLSPWSGYQGIYFDGTGDYLTCADDDAWYFNGDFSIDIVIRLDSGSTSADRDWIGQFPDETNYWVLQNRSAVSQFKLQAAVSGSSVSTSGSQITTTGAFLSVSLARKGNSTKSFVSGSLYGSATGLAFANAASPLTIGKGLLSNDFLGTIAGVRITNGTDRGYIDAGAAPNYVSLGPFAIP